MIEDKALVEKAAASENDWVRARILKKDPPPEGPLLQIAERARDLAANSLGRDHPAYAVALQNLGLYYDFIENDGSKATEFFKAARAVLKESDLPLAYGFFELGVFHYEANHNASRAEAALMEALAIQRRMLGNDELQLADTLVALAYAKVRMTDIDSAIPLMEEALKIQRVRLGSANKIVLDTEERLALLRRVAHVQPEDNCSRPTGSGVPDADKALKN
jgi:tetratricopeptide (TPR) repeat protein